MCNLKNDQSVVIKEGNKSSKLVIWDKKDYVMEPKNSFLVKNVMKGFRVTPLFYREYVCLCRLSVEINC